MKVLIVEDNANDRRLLRLNLERHGCEAVVEARDGREGYELAKAHKPDLIISDALMPGMDGFKLLRMLKTNDELKGTPFVFHSAVYTGLKDRELALSLGAEAFIAKPKEPDEFWEELSVILKECQTGRAKPEIAEPMEEEREYLRRYSWVVAAKLEEKVKELEETLAEHMRMETALRESERRYQEIFNNVSDGLFLLEVTGDGRFRYIEMNPALARSTGVPLEECVGKFVDETKPEAASRAAITQFRRCVEAGTVTHEDVELDLPFGHRFYSSSFIPLRDPSGRINRIVGISRDITESKRTEETIRRLNADLSATLQAIPDLLFEMDRNGVYLNIWAQNPDLLARQKELLLGHTVAEALAPDAAKIVMASIWEAEEKGSSYGKVIRIDFPDGARWFELSVAKKASTNVPGGAFIILSRDITERDRAEYELQRSNDLLRTIIEAVPTAIIGLDLDGKALLQKIRNSRCSSTMGRSGR